MENLRDEHIVCASCGVSFLFSAGEAAVFAQRGLALPKRCKECRRARKEQAAHADGGGQGRRAPGGFAGRGSERGATRAPRYTGDVNEYRSPMQDRSFAAPAAPFPGAHGDARPARGGYAPPFRDDGNYRAPSSQNNGRDAFGPPGRDAFGPPGRDAFGPPGRDAFGPPGRDAFGPPGGPRAPRGGPPSAPRGGQDGERSGGRRRPQAEVFSIVCNACGQSAEVPFRPAEGRDVYCQPCYRARKPS